MKHQTMRNKWSYRQELRRFDQASWVGRMVLSTQGTSQICSTPVDPRTERARPWRSEGPR